MFRYKTIKVPFKFKPDCSCVFISTLVIPPLCYFLGLKQITGFILTIQCSTQAALLLLHTLMLCFKTFFPQRCSATNANRRKVGRAV